MAYIVSRKKGGAEYFLEVEGYREGGTVKQKVLRYFGKQDPRVNPASKQIIKQEIQGTYTFGDIALLYHCARTMGFIEIIDKYMPKRQHVSHGLQLFLLAAHRLIGDKPSAHNLPRWCQGTFIPKLLKINPEKINDNTISYTMDCVYNEKQNIDHTLRIAKELYDRAHKYFASEEDICFYDLTSTYFEGRCCPIAKFGYNRDGLVDKLQINIGMTVDKSLGLPMMTKVFEGNIHDAKTVYEMVYYTKFVLNKKKAMLIMDRGMDSEDNIRIMDTTEYDYIIGLSSKHSFVKKLKLANDIFSSGWTTFVQKGTKVLLKKFNKNLFGKRRIVLLYYNQERAAQRKEKRDKAIAYAESKLREPNLTIKKTNKIIKGLSSFFEVTSEDGVVVWKKKQVIINQAERFDGKFCMVTNKDIDANDIYTLYFSKDKVEKAFRHLKQDLNLHPTRRRLTDRVRADVFVCHLGYFLLKVAETMVKQKKIELFWDDISTETKEIRILEYKKRGGDFAYTYVTNNKLQEDIVEKLELKKYIP